MTKLIALGYIRVSTGRQEVDGESLDRQAYLIRTMTEKLGYQCHAIYQDIGSAASPVPGSRPDFQDLLRDARSLEGVVFVTDATRLGRHPNLATAFNNPPIPVYDISERKILSPADLKKAFAAGASEAAGIRERSSTAAKLARRQPPDPKKGGIARSVAMRPSVDDRYVLIAEAFRLLEVKLGRRPSLREAASAFELAGFTVPGKVGRWHPSLIRTALIHAPRFIVDPESMFDLLIMA